MSNKIWGYTVVSYPESMPENWRLQLENLPMGYCYAIHDKDPKIDENGEIIGTKKAHIHFFFQGRPTSKQKEYIHATLNVSYGESVHDPMKMYEYLTHKNNPDKFHYPIDSIKHSDKWEQELFEQACSYSPDGKSKTVELLTFMKPYHEYYDLLQALVEQDRLDLISEAKQPWVKNALMSKKYGDL